MTGAEHDDNPKSRPSAGEAIAVPVIEALGSEMDALLGCLANQPPGIAERALSALPPALLMRLVSLDIVKPVPDVSEAGFAITITDRGRDVIRSCARRSSQSDREAGRSAALEQLTRERAKWEQQRQAYEVDAARAPLAGPLKRLSAAVAIAAFAAAIATLLIAPGWVIGATAGAVICVVTLHEYVWRWPPKPWAAAISAAGILGGGFVGVLLTSDHHSTNPSVARGPRSSAATQSANNPSPPALSPDATCASARQANLDYSSSHATFVDSPGQLTEGGRSLVGRVIPNGQYRQVVHVSEGQRLELSMRLHNAAYGLVAGVSIKLLTRTEAGCWKLTARASSSLSAGGNVTLGPAFVMFPIGPNESLKYLPGSTLLYDQNGRVLAHLADGILGAGVTLPYEIPGGQSYFVNCELRVA